MTPVRLEPAALRSRVKHSTTEPLPSRSEHIELSSEDEGSKEKNISVNLCSNRRVSTKQSPYLKVFHKHNPLQITLDSGAEVSMIKNSVASLIGANIISSMRIVFDKVHTGKFV